MLCLIVFIATAFYWYQKPRDSLTHAKPAYTLTAKALYDAFQQDEKKANQQFLKKVIQVTGTVDYVQATDTTITIVLAASNMGGINCNVRKEKDDVIPVKGNAVTVKGKCIGFLMDVNLVDVVIEK